MKADFKKFQEYCRKHIEMAEEFNAWFSGWLLEMAQRTIARTKKRTPVDTGALRNAWTIGNVRRNGDNFEIDLINNMEYASYIEYGTPARPNWKWADGAHMLTISMNEITDQMPKRFDKSFKEFLKLYGIE